MLGILKYWSVLVIISFLYEEENSGECLCLDSSVEGVRISFYDEKKGSLRTWLAVPLFYADIFSINFIATNAS
jgi:hypothetical protein